MAEAGLPFGKTALLKPNRAQDQEDGEPISQSSFDPKPRPSFILEVYHAIRQAARVSRGKGPKLQEETNLTDRELENGLASVFGLFIALAVAFVLIGVAVYFVGTRVSSGEATNTFLLEKAAAIFGLPIAALVSYLIVALLKQASGTPVKFTVGTSSFEGVSGQVVLWLACFLAIAGSIKMLWD